MHFLGKIFRKETLINYFVSCLLSNCLSPLQKLSYIEHNLQGKRSLKTYYLTQALVLIDQLFQRKTLNHISFSQSPFFILFICQPRETQVKWIYSKYTIRQLLKNILTKFLLQSFNPADYRTCWFYRAMYYLLFHRFSFIKFANIF